MDHVGAHRSWDALDRDGWLLGDLEDPAHEAIGLVADAQTADGGGLLHPGGHVHGISADVALPLDAPAEEHRPGVDTDADIETIDLEAGKHVSRHRAGLVEDRQTGSHGELRIVLAGLVGAECGEEPVAGVVHDPATVELHSGGEPLQDPVHQLVDVLGVEPVGDGSGTDDVDEQDRRLSQLLVGSAGWEISCGELITERCQRQVCHRVAERVPLPLDRLDRGRDVLAVDAPVWHGRTLGRPFGGVTRSVSAGVICRPADRVEDLWPR